ncbi:MAG TPA: hypothetical protein VEZ39_01150, partial [Sulfuricurvum sp.]|nr:hypothetical protein [Sulfuricurvum sp.]
MKTLILFVLFAGYLFAVSEPSVLTDPAPQEDTTTAAPAQATEPNNEIGSLFSGVSSPLKLQFDALPTHPYVGEIIAVPVKLTPVDIASGNIEYTLQNEEGIRIFSDTPRRSVKEDGVYDTFYFLVQSPSIRLPDITATLSATGANSETLVGTSLSATPLNPPSTFAKVLADKFEIINYKTTPYNSESNVVIFTVKASRCNIGDFTIPNAIKQGFESNLPNVG